MDNILSIVTFIPAIAAGILALFLHGEDVAAQRNAKWVALVATTVTFLVSIGIYTGFDPSNTGFQMVEEGEWLMGLKYKMGVDGISVLFVLLTTFIMPLTILASWNVTDRVKEYMIAFLVHGNVPGGRLHARSISFFSIVFFEGRPHSDVPDHRHLGRSANRDVCQLQILPVHASLARSSCSWPSWPCFAEAGNDRHPGVDEPSVLVRRVHCSGCLYRRRICRHWLWIAFFASFAVKLPMWPVPHVAA